MSENFYKLLFVTPEAEKSNLRYTVYKNKSEYGICSYYEIQEYLDQGYKRLPGDFEKELKEEIKKEEDAIESIDLEMAEVDTKQEQFKEVLAKRRGRPPSK